MSAKKIVFAGGLSGALAALALPPFHLWPLAFVALVPIAWALGGPEDGVERDAAVRAGLAFGAVFYGLLLHWIPFTAHGMTPAGALSGVLAIGILAGVGGAQGVALHAVQVRWAASPVLALPLVWTGTELALAHAGPLAFPWTPLGLSLASVPELAGIAEWAGPRGLTLWIAAVNGGVAAACVALRPERARRRPALLLAAGTLVLVSVPAAWGTLRAERLPLRSLPPVLVAQLHIPRDTLLNAGARDRAAAAALDRIVPESVPANASQDRDGAGRPVLALFPEAPFAATWGGEVEAGFGRLARRLGVPVVAGAHREDAVRDRRRNDVLVIEPGGAVTALHSKRRLVPGVESPGLASGPAGEAATVGGIVLGALICFESAFAGEAGRRRFEGAELLVNPSNDGWFRPVGVGVRAANAQHRAHLVLRAVETRAGAVRPSLGGELLVIAPTGRVIVSRPPGGEGLLPVRPITSTATTAFVRFGEAGLLAALLLLGAAVGIGAPRTLPGMQTGEGPIDRDENVFDTE